MSSKVVFQSTDVGQGGVKTHYAIVSFFGVAADDPIDHEFITKSMSYLFMGLRTDASIDQTYHINMDFQNEAAVAMHTMIVKDFLGLHDLPVPEQIRNGQVSILRGHRGLMARYVDNARGELAEHTVMVLLDEGYTTSYYGHMLETINKQGQLHEQFLNYKDLSTALFLSDILELLSVNLTFQHPGQRVPESSVLH